MDSPDDLIFRRFAEQALSVMPGTSIAAVSLVDADRQWFKVAVGMDTRETQRSDSCCSHTIETDAHMVVEDATKDGRFRENPLVTSAPGIRFYAGAKLMEGLGAICVIGRHPRKATSDEIRRLVRLARCVDIQLLAHGTFFNLR